MDTTGLQAQVPQEFQHELAEGRKMLREKGIPEAEVRKRMMERGYDINNLDPTRIPEYRKALQEVIAEIENEMKQAAQEKAQKEAQAEAEAKKQLNDAIKPDKPEQTTDTETQVDDIKEQVVENVIVSKKEGSEAEEAAENISEELQKVAPNTNIYGHQIFTEGQLSLYRAAEDIATPGDYVLSTGDEILVSIFGRSQADFRLVINKQGYVQPEAMPKIFLKGLPLKKARDLIRRRMRMRYSFLPEQFSATLITARTVTLNIFGEVIQPGSYTISALNTGFNALLAAGGITKNGSVRKIKLIKGDGEEKLLDVYKYLSNPKVQFDFPIDDKDILYVPLSQNIVTINGAVRRPMKYEMLDGETLKDLIEYAGGLQSDAYTELATISRLTGEERVIIDIPLAEYLESDADFTLRDGDIITIKAVEGKLKKYVEVDGYVEYPGKYDFTEGMTLADLITKARFKDLTRTDLAFLFRENEDKSVRLIKLNLDKLDESKFSLQLRDRLVFYSVRQFMNSIESISISGAVRNPVTIDFDLENEIKIADLITYAGGIKPNARNKAIVKRIDRSNKNRVEYLEVDVFKALADTSGAENIVLQQGDQVTIFSNEQFTEAENIQVLGEVRNPTEIRYDSTLSLKEAITLAGGLKKNANNIAIIRSHAEDNNKEVSYTRVNLNKVFSGELEVDLQPKDVIRIYDKNMYLEEFEVSVLGEVKKPGKFAFDESLSIQDLIYMAGGLTLQASTNKVDLYRLQIMENQPTQVLHKTITLEKVSQDAVQVLEDVVLQPYDILVVRPIPNFEYQKVVYVNGEVKYPGPYVIDNNEVTRMKEIIVRAGGLEADAFAAGATLIRRNGETQGKIIINMQDALKSNNNRENIVMLNGDVLFIPKLENTVSIRTTGTLSEEVLIDSVLVNNTIQMAYQGRKSAKWYIKNYAGGYADNADKSSTRVIYPGGRVNSTKTYFWFIRNYPTVVEGSTIVVDLEPPEPPEEKKEREKIDWEQFLRDTIATVTSVVTLLVLLNQLNK